MLGPMFHEDLDFWRWFVKIGLASRGGQFFSPMYNVLIRPPKLTLFSDASKQAVGGYCVETGHYWRYDLSAEERSRFCGSSKSVVGVNDISINVLELLGMLVGAWLLVVQQQHRPAETGDCVLLRGDNEATVAWIQRCRCGKEPRSGALMRLLGVLGVSSAWHFQASHVSGVLNSLADGIPRWNPHDVHANLCDASPRTQWRELGLGQVGRRRLPRATGKSRFWAVRNRRPAADSTDSRCALHSSATLAAQWRAGPSLFPHSVARGGGTEPGKAGRSGEAEADLTPRRGCPGCGCGGMVKAAAAYEGRKKAAAG